MPESTGAPCSRPDGFRRIEEQNGGRAVRDGRRNPEDWDRGTLTGGNVAPGGGHQPGEFAQPGGRDIIQSLPGVQTGGTGREEGRRCVGTWTTRCKAGRTTPSRAKSSRGRC